MLCRSLGATADGGDLRHADTRDDPRRANRSGTDADLDHVDAGFDQCARALAGSDVAGGDVEIGITAANLADDIEDIFRMAMGRVHRDQIDARAHQPFHPRFPIADAHRRADAQPAA